MFLTPPTIAELQLLDLATLTEMLVLQTKQYIQIANDEGFGERTSAIQQLLDNVQAAIKLKQLEPSRRGPGG